MYVHENDYKRTDLIFFNRSIKIELSVVTGTYQQIVRARDFRIAIGLWI